MLEKLTKWMEDNRDYGLTFFYAYDPVSEKASITLFMAYVSFILTLVSLITLHFTEKVLTATVVSAIFTSIMVVFYLIRSINKANFNLKEKSFSLESNDDKQKEKKDE